MNRFRSILCGRALVLAVTGEGARAQAPPARPPRAAAAPDAAAVERRLVEAARAHARQLRGAPRARRVLPPAPASCRGHPASRARARPRPGPLRQRLRPRRRLPGDRRARRRAPAGAADARGEGDGRAVQPARRRRRARRRLRAPPPSAISAPRASQPTEEHLFDWGDNLLRLRALRRRRDVFTAGIRRHPDVGAAAHRASASRSTRAASTRTRWRSFCRAADLGARRPAPLRVPRRDVRRLARRRAARSRSAWPGSSS